MDTLRKLTNDLLELRYKIRSDDNIITERQVHAWISQQRSIWVSNELNKNRFDPAYWQHTGKVTVSTNADWGADYLVAEELIPKLIEVHGRPAIIKVNDGNNIVSTMNFPWIKPQDLEFMGNRRFDSKTIFSSIMGNTLVLRRPLDDSDGVFDTITVANLIGIFEEPMDLKVFDEPDGSPVYHEDMPYPIHLKLYTYMREQIVKVNFPVEAQASDDKTNDGTANE